ncbi:hypothetical protein EV363DRAFT_733695 [Boletus edulis]|nr:hypothetical protein EV363DRAFT_733695 [Boletus edulis]
MRVVLTPSSPARVTFSTQLESTSHPGSQTSITTFIRSERQSTTTTNTTTLGTTTISIHRPCSHRMRRIYRPSIPVPRLNVRIQRQQSPLRVLPLISFLRFWTSFDLLWMPDGPLSTRRTLQWSRIHHPLPTCISPDRPGQLLHHSHPLLLFSHLPVSARQPPPPPLSLVYSRAHVMDREIDTKIGGEAGMAGVGRRGFVLAASRSPHQPAHVTALGDGHRVNVPRYLDTNDTLSLVMRAAMTPPPLSPNSVQTSFSSLSPSRITRKQHSYQRTAPESSKLSWCNPPAIIGPCV